VFTIRKEWKVPKKVRVVLSNTTIPTIQAHGMLPSRAAGHPSPRGLVDEVGTDSVLMGARVQVGPEMELESEPSRGHENGVDSGLEKQNADCKKRVIGSLLGVLKFRVAVEQQGKCG